MTDLRSVQLTNSKLLVHLEISNSPKLAFQVTPESFPLASVVRLNNIRTFQGTFPPYINDLKLMNCNITHFDVQWKGDSFSSQNKLLSLARNPLKACPALPTGVQFWVVDLRYVPIECPKYNAQYLYGCGSPMCASCQQHDHPSRPLLQGSMVQLHGLLQPTVQQRVSP